MRIEKPAVRSDDKNDPIVAILASDLHLSQKPPLIRADDWYVVQKRYLRQLYEATPSWEVPILVAGDIFDKWNAPPELISFAIDNLPEIYAVPGQHDLPNHNLEDIGKSAFWTLVKTGKIHYLKPEVPEVYRFPFTPNKGLSIHGFPFGSKLTNLTKTLPGFLHVAVIHSYCWKGNNRLPNAVGKQHVNYFRNKLKGFHAAVVGDNHRGFLSATGELPIIYNSGGFIRRKSDEIEYQPRIGLLHSSGRITQKRLATSKDVFNSIETKFFMGGETEEANEFINELKSLGDHEVNFSEKIKQFLAADETICEETKRLVLQSLEAR
jgi:hypothetical protein